MTDRLDSLLQRFSVSARMFHSGPLCGVTDFYFGEHGQLHLIKRGPVRVQHARGKRTLVAEPSLLFYPRPLHHRLITDAHTGADMACANVAFNAGVCNPIAQALPAVVIMPLADVIGAEPVLELLFREAFARNNGRQHVVNRLFEVVLVLILRTLIERANITHGLLGALNDPRLAKALLAMHEEPAADWSLEKLAAVAGMSRSHFAAMFAERVGTTPVDYLTRFRIGAAQDLLRKGDALKMIAGSVGYGSTAALSRAFRACCGMSPREWKAANVGDGAR